jgi:hypothetical protein
VILQRSCDARCVRNGPDHGPKLGLFSQLALRHPVDIGTGAAVIGTFSLIASSIRATNIEGCAAVEA